MLLFCVLSLQAQISLQTTGPVSPMTVAQTPKMTTPLIDSGQYPPIPLTIKEHELQIPFITSLPQSGDNSVTGKQLLAGVKNYLQTVKAFIRPINANQKIQFIHEGNNSIQGPEGLTRLQELSKKSPLVLGLLGTDLFLTLIKFVVQKKFLMLFPIEGSDLFRQTVPENVIYFRPSHKEELDALVQYTIKFERRKKIAFFYEASEWGESVVATLEKLLKKYDVTSIVKASYSQGTVDVQRAINKISSESPNAVFCLASARATYNFIRNGINAGLHKCLFLGMSFLQSIQLLLKTSRGLDLVITSVVPDATKSGIPLVKEYKEATKTFLSYRPDSPFYFESYIGLALLSEAVKGIQTDISPASLIKSFESIKDLDFKGLKLNFDQKKRTLSTAVWVSPRVDQPWISKQELDER